MPTSSETVNTEAFDYFPALKRVREYFDKNYAAPMTLKKAAGIAGLEEKYFSSMFRRHVGVGFKEWTNRLRIQKALDAIERENQSLTVVALSVGFQSPATFQRLFKKHVHMRPRDFRNAVLHKLHRTENLSV
jgi:AraC-like DNA-binding protein